MSERREAEANVPNPQKLRRLWHGLRVAALVLVFPLLFLLAGLVLMFDRDITAPSWIKTRVSAAAQEVLAGGSLEFGEITVNVGRDLHPRVALTDTVLKDAEGTVIAEVDRMNGLLSPRGVLFERNALVQTVELDGVAVALKRDLEGAFALSFDQSTGAVTQSQDLSGLLVQLDAIFQQPALVALEGVKLINLSVVFDDAQTGQNWRIENGQANLNVKRSRMDASLSLPVQQPQGQDAIIAANFSRLQGDSSTEIAISIENANAADMATLAPALSWLSAVQAPMSGQLKTGLDTSGNLAPLFAELSIAKGSLQPSTTARPIPFDEANVTLTFLPDQNIIAFERIALRSPWVDLSGEGQALLLDLTGGIPSQIVTQLDLSDIKIDPPSYFDLPKRVERLALDFRVNPQPFSIEVGQATVTDIEMPVEFSGSLAARDDGWHVAVDFASNAIDQANVSAWWPNGMKPKSRAWFRENLTAGVLTDVAGGIRLSPLHGLQYAIGFSFENAIVRMLKEMPPIESAIGYAAFVDNAFDLELTDGVMIAPLGGGLDFGGSSMRIHDLRMKPSPMDLNFSVDSTITSALSVLDLPPFEFMKKANLPVDVADGHAEIKGTVTFPLTYAIRGEDVRVDMAANLRELRSEAIVPDHTLRSELLTLNVTNETLTIEGLAYVNGSPFDGAFIQRFGPNGDRVVTADVALSPQFLDDFGIGLPPGTMRGQSQGNLTVSLPTGEPPQFRLTSNLRGLGASLPSVGWVKPPAASGELLIAGALSTPIRIDQLDISASGLQAKGAVVLNNDNTLNLARFRSFSVGNWLDAPVTLRGRGEGRPASVELRGGRIDIRQAQLGTSDAESGPLTVNLDRVQVTDGLALTGLRGEFGGAGGLSGQFDASVNGLAAVRGTIVQQNGGSAVRIVSDDAGGVLAAAGLLKSAIGGALDLSLIPTGASRVYDGAAVITGLRVRDAPAIAELLNAISVVGLLQQLDGQGLAFDEVDARFQLSPNSVVISQSSATGPGLGISLDGVYTLANKSMDFQGVISPIYLLNGIGSILTRKGEGLIGFNFNLSGSVDRPNVSVNPLSALTPGMFREIFRRPAPEVSQ